MKPLFNKTFFKFTGRFFAIVLISIMSIFLIRYIEIQNEGVSATVGESVTTE